MNDSPSEPLSDPMPAFDAAWAASILAEARRNGTKIAVLPGPARPRTIGQAYAIQDQTARLCAPVGGWKASFEADGKTATVAPVAQADVFAGAGLAMPGPLQLEVEFAVKLIADLPANAAPFDAATMDRAIGPAFVVFEILGSRFADRNAISPFEFLADGNGNAAIVIGEEIADWRRLDLATLDVRLRVDDAEHSRKTSGGAPAGQVLDLLAALANHAAEHIGGLKAGQVIITGARVGPVAIAARRVATGSINGRQVVLKLD